MIRQMKASKLVLMKSAGLADPPARRQEAPWENERRRSWQVGGHLQKKYVFAPALSGKRKMGVPTGPRRPIRASIFRFCRLMQPICMRLRGKTKDDDLGRSTGTCKNNRFSLQRFRENEKWGSQQVPADLFGPPFFVSGDQCDRFV